jgi:FAD synthase
MARQIDILCSETTLYNAWNVVREKGAAGGIDGITIQKFEKDKRRQISRLAEELVNQTWKPYPYLEIEVAKEKSQEEKRKISMTAIRDKIVQLAIKGITNHVMTKSLLAIAVWQERGLGKLYPLCTECYARIEYIPPVKKKEPVKIAVI